MNINRKFKDDSHKEVEVVFKLSDDEVIESIVGLPSLSQPFSLAEQLLAGSFTKYTISSAGRVPVIVAVAQTGLMAGPSDRKSVV